MNIDLPAWLAPTPDSRIAEVVRQGRPPANEFVHLLWSVWVFITPMFSGGYDARWVALTVLSYPLFLVLYAKTLLASRHASPWYALGMIALSMALLPTYPSALSYFIFGCVMLRVCGAASIGHYLIQLLALNAVVLTEAWWIGYPWQALVWVPALTLIIGIIVQVDRSEKQKDAALRLSHDEVRRLAATAERERIGRDLHDLLGHTLSLITLKLELARKLSERDPAGSRHELADAERVARHALAEVRSAVTGIRSSSLAAELASARLMLESSLVHLEYEPPSMVLSPEVERGLSLVLREAVTNIARHARGSLASIEFSRDGDTLQLCIFDDGRGGVDADGNGITGMRDRVRALGGSLAIESPRGQGTRLRVYVPLDTRRTEVAPVAPDASESAPDFGAAPAGATTARAI